MKKIDKREKILETANRLFELHGFHATGVDQLAAESGVTKRTLYKHFGSKEGLIEEVLRNHHDNMMQQTRAAVLQVAAEGDARLMTCFALYRVWFGQSNFSGCIFVKTLNEFAGCSPRLTAIARRAKADIREFIKELAADAGAEEPLVLAEQLQLILEGCIVLAQAGRGPAIVDVAEEMAKALIAKMIN